MDYIKQWTLTVCITIIIAVILSLISPDGTMGRFYKTIISLFMITSFILPIAKVDFNDINFEFKTDEVYADSGETYQNEIESEVKKQLDDAGYTSCIVECDVNIQSDEIYINSLSISVPSEYDKGKVKDVVFDKIGMVADVKYVGE